MTATALRAPHGIDLRRDSALLVGAVIVAAVVLIAAISLLWTPFDPERSGDAAKLLSPAWPHILGTDRLGTDTFSMIMAGSRTTLLVGTIAVGIAALLGIPAGLAAAMSGHRGETILMRTQDLLLAFPALLLAIILGAAFGASTVTAMTAIGIGTSPAFARIARAGARTVLHHDYALAARAAGRGPVWILLRHVLPHIAPLLIVQASSEFAVAVLAEASLSYLGLGTTPPTPSWGRMVQEAQGYLYSAPLQVLWPALAIAITVLGFTLLGDGLRDRLDPQLRDVA